MKQKEYDQWNGLQDFYSDDYFLPKKGVATPHEYSVECYPMHVTVDDVNFCIGLDCVYVKYTSRASTTSMRVKPVLRNNHNRI